jgi:D-sedoheptulose 7-phosphate isomerase
MNFIKNYLKETKDIINALEIKTIERIIDKINVIRKNNGRIFFIGVGGSAGNASHAVNDFRKLAGIECYAPTDNVSELTARTNDEGWDTVFEAWLATSKLNNKDGIFVFSVGGGDKKKNISPNIVNAVKYAKKKKAKILGIVGKKGGYTKKNADVCVSVPVQNIKHITPHSEAFQGVIWHLIITHPKIKKFKTKW